MAEETKNINVLKPTSGADWRRQSREGVNVTLPSGFIARIRNVQLTALMVAIKQLPNNLSSIVYANIYGDAKGIEKRPLEDLLSGMIKLQDTVCIQAFVEPRVVDNPEKDDEISLEDIPPGDKVFLLALLQQSAQELARFRHEAS